MVRLDLVRGDEDVGYRKGVLLLLNLLVTFVGIELIALGIYDLSRGNIPRGTFIVPSVYIIIGVLVFLFSFHGHGAIFFESKQQLRAYFVVLMLFSILLAIALIFEIYGRSNVGKVVTDYWISIYDDSPYILRNIEEEFGCCGLKTTLDYAYPKNKPDACIESPYFGYKVPCYNLLKRAVANEMDNLLIWTSIAFIIVFVTALFDYYTFSGINDSDEREGLLRSYH